MVSLERIVTPSDKRRDYMRRAILADSERNRFLVPVGQRNSSDNGFIGSDLVTIYHLGRCDVGTAVDHLRLQAKGMLSVLWIVRLRGIREPTGNQWSFG